MDSKIDIGCGMGVVSVNTAKTSVEIHGLCISPQLFDVLDHLLCDTYQSCIKLTLKEMDIYDWDDPLNFRRFRFSNVTKLSYNSMYLYSIQKVSKLFKLDSRKITYLKCGTFGQARVCCSILKDIRILRISYHDSILYKDFENIPRKICDMFPKLDFKNSNFLSKCKHHCCRKGFEYDFTYKRVDRPCLMWYIQNCCRLGVMYRVFIYKTLSDRSKLSKDVIRYIMQNFIPRFIDVRRNITFKDLDRISDYYDCGQKARITYDEYKFLKSLIKIKEKEVSTLDTAERHFQKHQKRAKIFFEDDQVALKCKVREHEYDLRRTTNSILSEVLDKFIEERKIGDRVFVQPGRDLIKL